MGTAFKSVLWAIAALAFALLQPPVIAANPAVGETAGANPALGINIDSGWRLWLDEKAPWQNDTIFLPEDVKLKALPVNAPTGGWAVLNDTAGIPVALPSTVEEHYWGRSPARKPKSDRREDIVNAEGNYLGVSWWYRPFTPPKLKPGERLIFSFPAGRLRSEVYVNGKLTGYSIISEAPFTADATDAINPDGNNLLAVRITNPGGRLDWMDFLSMNWGNAQFPATHGFGGLAGGVEMQVRGSVSISDLAVLNKPNPREVTLIAEVASSGPAYTGTVALSIARKGSIVWTGSAPVQVPAGGIASVSVDASVPDAALWDVHQPNLYTATAQLPEVDHSNRSTQFGFRWFTARGIGSDAKLYLNDRRIVPISSISWGFWAPNGIFPDQAAADREVAAMNALGLNSLQNHRHMPKAIVLDTFDRNGLLHYCEAGGGMFTFHKDLDGGPQPTGPVDTSGNGANPDFTNRYQLDKELAMIRADRSHPSVTVWTLQNEISPDLKNPLIFNALNKMRELDPSRMIVLKSGVDPKNQVWSLPYSSQWMFDDGSGFSGWWDTHTADDSPGVYCDSMYKSPDDFEYHTNNKKEITVWGEMATGASPDDHAAMAAWYKSNHRTGYDREAHEAILSAYNDFLDQRGFRSAFPSAEGLFREAGNKHYFSAAHVLENARICNDLDYIVLSGWESTTIDDHSGMVDSLRLLKGDPSPMHQAAAPELLVVRPRQYVVARGGNAAIDIHLVNENNLNGACLLTVLASLPGKPSLFQATYPVTVSGGEIYGQLLKSDIEFPINDAGTVTVQASLAAAGNANPILKRDERFLVIDPQPEPLKRRIACVSDSNSCADALREHFNAASVPLDQAQGKIDVILIETHSDLENWRESEARLSADASPDYKLFEHTRYGKAGVLRTYRNLKPGKVTVDLYLIENYFDHPGGRLFDIALNGQTVAADFDIFAEAGGSKRPLIKTFTVDAPDGKVALSIPRVKRDAALLAAVRVTDSSGKIIREVFNNNAVTDSQGVRWESAIRNGFDWSTILPAVLPRVQEDGTRLVLLTSGGADAEAAASWLAERKLIEFSGAVGREGPSWMGFWYFGKRHWLLSGLPSDCVLDWPYQITHGNGLIMSGPGLDAVVAYGKDHDVKLGIAASVIKCGNGQIVLLSLPGLARSFISGHSDGFQPVTATRLIYNALH
jgi:hypothetical protein